MARNKTKRPYGMGSLFREGKGWAMRWREKIVDADGNERTKRCYEAIGPMTKKEAQRRLADKLAEAEGIAGRPRVSILFRDHVKRWKRDILPYYKFSTQKSHSHVIDTKLLDRFGDVRLVDLGGDEIQRWVSELAEAGYAAHSIRDYHKVLSSVLKVAVRWGYIAENPAHGALMPKLRPKVPPWALTPSEAHALLGALRPKARAMAALGIFSGLRRGEILALRWSGIDPDREVLHVREAVYDGHVDTPKTEKGVRVVPLSIECLQILAEWRKCAANIQGDDLVFGTRNRKPESPNNILRRHVYPACDRLGLKRASWQTFRRTYSTLLHDHGLAGKSLADLMGHEQAATSENIYAQPVEAAKRAAVEAIGAQVGSNGQNLARSSLASEWVS